MLVLNVYEVFFHDFTFVKDFDGSEKTFGDDRTIT
jgi:hypothetical protein